MKKKILFIISNMESGGVSKSMLSLLHTLDKVKYDIDLLVVNPVGVFMNQLPTGINVITDKRASLFFSKFPHNIVLLLRNGYWFAAFCRLLAGIISRFDRGWAGLLMSKFLPDLPDMYNLAVDYNGQQQLYYLIDKVKAEKKVSFFHNDYSKWPYYYSIDKVYYQKANFIYTVSEGCVKSLKVAFPNVANKIGLFENISSLSSILSFASEVVVEDLSAPLIITVGHLCERKGTSIALEAARIIKESNISFKWYFIGADTKEKNYIKMLQDFKLENNVSFLGLRENPYPYMAAATIIVHPSKYEGKSIALDEAKILAKPVVVTNFSTVNDQFIHRYNATITGMNAIELSTAIKELLYDPCLAAIYTSNLTKDCSDNSNEINKLYNLL